MRNREFSKLHRNGGTWAANIPPAIRQFLSLRPGDQILFTVVDDGVVMDRLDLDRIRPLADARRIVRSLATLQPAG